MSPNRCPIGVWITTIYLFVLLALGVFYLVLAIDAANAGIGDLKNVGESHVDVDKYSSEWGM